MIKTENICIIEKQTITVILHTYSLGTVPETKNPAEEFNFFFPLLV